MIVVENILIAIITGIVAIIVASIGIQQRRNTSNISKNTESIDGLNINPIKLIETLNNTVDAQNKQIDILRGIVDEQRIQLKEKDDQLIELTKRVSNLEQLTIEQALIIRGLERSKGHRTQHEGGETQEHE